MIKGDINIVVADREDITTMAKHPPSIQQAQRQSIRQRKGLNGTTAALKATTTTKRLTTKHLPSDLDGKVFVWGEAKSLLAAKYSTREETNHDNGSKVSATEY
jgi:NADPH-dependent ferric siderophore reductase